MLRRILIIWLLSATVWADTPPSTEQQMIFCTDPETAVQNEKLAKKHPTDELLIKLVALRIGLCDLLAKEVIGLEFAIDLFEGERVKGMFKRREEELSKRPSKAL